MDRRTKKRGRQLRAELHDGEKTVVSSHIIRGARRVGYFERAAIKEQAG